MKGRYFKFFLPFLTGLFLVVSTVLIVANNDDHQVLANGTKIISVKSSTLTDHECDSDELSHGPCGLQSPTPTPTVTPSPSPSHEPCEDDEDCEPCDHETCPTPTPSPTPTPTPSPSPSAPPVGGPGGGEGGGNVKSCPVNNLPQKVDQVWFTDVQANQVTVHWANKGDAQGYNITYGLEPNNWLWGVKVGNVSEVTLKGLPTSNIWVSVIPLGQDDCAGESSNPVTPGGEVLGAKVLGATGVINNLMLFLAGFGSLGLGLWYAQRVLRRQEA